MCAFGAHASSRIWVGWRIDLWIYFSEIRLQLWIEIPRCALHLGLIRLLLAGSHPGKQVVAAIHANFLVDIV